MTADIIALSQGVRASLLASQATAAQQAETSARLASGLKVDSALDNPTNFFTAASLDARATQLNALSDGFNNARSTIQAAVDAQEKALELIDLMGAAREGAWQALKRGEYKNLTRIATAFSTDSLIDPVQTTTGTGGGQVARQGRLQQLIDDLNAAPDDAARIARVEAFRINDFHQRPSAGQEFYISVGQNEDYAQAEYLSTGTGSKTIGQFIGDVEANIPNLDVSVVIDNAFDAPFDTSMIKLEFALPERDDRAVYMTGYFNIFQNLNLNHGIYWSEDPDTEKTLLSFERIDTLHGTAGTDDWRNEPIGTYNKGWHTSDPDGPYPDESWVLDDGVNPELTFIRGTDGTTLGEYVDFVNDAHSRGDFGFRMEVINDTADPDVGKLKVYNDGAAANRLLFRPRLSELFYDLRIDGTANGGAGQPYHIQNAGNPPAPGIPPATYNIENDYWDQFETARTQLDDIVADGRFLGTALGKGDIGTVELNERGSRLQMRQEETSTREIGLSRALDYEFQMFDRLDVIENEIALAREEVKSRLTQLRTELMIIDTRASFTDEMVNVLQKGASNLVLANSDEEGANMLAANTRQQLTAASLQLASQADQSVLRLF